MFLLTYTMMQMHSYSTAKTIPNITESCATWRRHPHIWTEDWDYKRIPFTTSTLHKHRDTQLKHYLINDALTPACKGRQAHNEFCTHWCQHISQPTPAWNQHCTAGFSFSVCDAFPDCFTGGQWHGSAPLLKNELQSDHESLPSSVVCYCWFGFPKAGGKWIIAFHFSITMSILFFCFFVWKKQTNL